MMNQSSNSSRATQVRRGLLIGTGYFSDFHLDAWARLPHAEIIGVCDVDEERARRAATKFGVTNVFHDVRQALELEGIDFIDVATTPNNRLELMALVAQRKLPVICQKPLANDWATAQKIVGLAEEMSALLMVHENFRFQPWYREIKRLLTEGRIGRKLHTLSMRTRMGDGWGEDAYLARQPYFRTMPRLLVHETGVHFVDTFRYLAGEIDECQAILRKLNSGIAGEDAGQLNFQFSSGAMGVWDANRYNESQAENPRYTFGELLVEGDEGSMWLDGRGGITIKRLGEAVVEHPYHRSQLGFAGDCVLATQQHFLDCLDGGKCETSGTEYLKSLAVVEALYESSERRCVVSLVEHSKSSAPQATQGRPPNLPPAGSLHPHATDSLTRRIVDLSLPVTPKMPGVEVSQCKFRDADGWNATMLQLYSHSGTHMDAPCHVLEAGATLDQQDLSACCGPAWVVHVPDVSPQMLLTVAHVTDVLGDLEPGARLLLRTDWHRRFGTPEYRHALPRISEELAHWLVDRKVALVGVEQLSVADVNNREELAKIHEILFRGGVVIVEALANLDQLTQPQVEFIALPLNIVGGDGCPVRAVAIEYGTSLPAGETPHAP
ncbi:cyclase family protein [Aureliella helgolandensis]|uniref:Kynurenine formamidase n=1 Tax=Aureliella helgolandensis TaxID=2527968 RepID=A0A518GA94_9BACT|nr:cyclase family protein [Aureliella helgolandensis]QDV25515.1 Kynurenine formamidase [Aureliella helgolandensis]